MVAQNRQVLDLVGAIYDTALDRADLGSVIGRISAGSGGHSAVLRLVDCRRESESFVIAYGQDEHFLQAYRDHFVHLDPYREFLAASPPGELVIGESAVPLRVRRHTEIFNDYEKPQGRIHVVGSNMGRDQDFLLYLGMHRSERAGPYGEQDLDFIRPLLPHLLRAVQIKRLLGEAVEAQRLSETLMDRLRLGVLLLDKAGSPRFANAAARKMADAFGLQLQTNGISLADTRANKRLQILIGQITQRTPPGRESAGGDIIVRHSGAGTLQLRVFPIAPRGDPVLTGREIRIVIFLVRPGGHTLPPDQITALWGLTPAEGRLVARLIEGGTLEAAAIELGIAVSTARTQLSAVFAKTGCHRQTELVAMLLTSLAAFDNRAGVGEV